MKEFQCGNSKDPSVLVLEFLTVVIFSYLLNQEFETIGHHHPRLMFLGRLRVCLLSGVSKGPHFG
jgi:hypothetical protein